MFCNVQKKQQKKQFFHKKNLLKTIFYTNYNLKTFVKIKKKYV